MLTGVVNSNFRYLSSRPTPVLDEIHSTEYSRVKSPIRTALTGDQDRSTTATNESVVNSDATNVQTLEASDDALRCRASNGF